MAIVLQEQKATNWRVLVLIVLVVAAVAAGAYFLFWSEAPAIEKVIPMELKSAAELSNVKFRADLDSVVRELPPRGRFQQHVRPAPVPPTGRENPFIRF